MEKLAQTPPPPCPWLPDAAPRMSWRCLREAAADEEHGLFTAAQRYAQWLWLHRQPARAILALCRALYLDPDRPGSGRVQPYRAYRWMLEHHDGSGFLGNPRISFSHQALRIAPERALKRQRAWAMWHLTRAALPDLPADPRVRETPPAVAELADYLDRHGLPAEGRTFLQALRPDSAAAAAR